jgi:hypothetical protein
MIPVPRKQGY